jgi:hypothetical protein
MNTRIPSSQCQAKKKNSTQNWCGPLGSESPLHHRRTHPKSETPIVPYEGSDRYFDCVTKTSFSITGKITMPLNSNPNLCVLISKITTPIIFGLYYMRCVDFQLKFPEMCISWPRTLLVRSYLPPARSLAGPTCPKCGLNGHVQSKSTEVRA